MISAHVAACFSAFITTAGDPESAAEGASTGTVRNQRITDMSPGEVHYLGEGETVNFATPAQTADGNQYLESQLRQIATGLQMPYEVLAKCWGHMSYSGGRLALIDGRLVFKVRQKLMGEVFLIPLWRRFVLECLLKGYLSIEPFFYNKNRWLIESAAVVGSGWDWIEPSKDVSADMQSAQAFFKTRTQILAERGLDFEEVCRQVAAERKILEKYELPLDMPLPNVPFTQLDSDSPDNAATGNQKPAAKSAPPQKKAA